MMHWQLNPSLSKHSHINLKNCPPGGDDKDINCYCCQPNHQQGELLRKMDPINNKGREFFCCPKPPDEHCGYGLMRLMLVPAMDFSELEMVGMPVVNVVGEKLFVNMV